jgi:hypothetical protein
MIYEASRVHVGLLCVAPIKRGNKRRGYEDVRVTWVSTDPNRHVVEVETTSAKAKVVKSTFPRSALRPPGTPTPPLGVVV